MKTPIRPTLGRTGVPRRLPCAVPVAPGERPHPDISDDSPPKRRPRGHTYHVQLLPQGTPVPQGRRHFCDNGVFCGHHHLKLPVKLRGKQSACANVTHDPCLRDTRQDKGDGRLGLARGSADRNRGRALSRREDRQAVPRSGPRRNRHRTRRGPSVVGRQEYQRPAPATATRRHTLSEPQSPSLSPEATRLTYTGRWLLPPQPQGFEAVTASDGRKRPNSLGVINNETQGRTTLTWWHSHSNATACQRGRANGSFPSAKLTKG